MAFDPTVIFGTLIFLFSLILLNRGKKSNLVEPPLVPYKYPIIGHTIEYFRDSETFIKECHEKYGEIFSLYLYGKVVSFVGKELSPEVFRNHENFNFSEATNETFPLSDFMHRPNEFFQVLAKVVQANLTGDLKLYTERVQRQLVKSIDEIIGDGKVLEPPLEFIQFIIAKPIAATMVGEELCDDKELVNSFAYATRDVTLFLGIPPVLSFINPTLNKKFLVMIFKYLNTPYKVHRELIKSKITPVINNRLNQMKKLGSSYVPPTDILQRYMEIFLDNYTVDIEIITDYMIITIFASVHTTSQFLTFSLHEWVNNPQCHKEILEEQEQLYKNSESPYYTIEKINEMKKLNSFLRESLRIGVNVASLPHKTLSPYFTFSNGYQVPKGRFVYIRSKEIHFDEQSHGQNPNDFNAFRHLEKNLSASRVDKNFLLFGSGKHACPGRFFAVNEIKVALHFLILKYNIRRASDKKIEPKKTGTMILPSGEGIIFEKRNNSVISNC